MTDSALHAALCKEFPLPKPSPKWVSEVSQILAAEQPVTLESLREEYLWSNLSDSTLPAPTALPMPVMSAGASNSKTTLFPRPVLVQLMSMSEIGASAFSLRTTLEARRDVLSGATRIRRLDDEEDEEVDVGKVPPYPRNMLSMELSDGHRTVRAVEYRRCDQFTLAETRAGVKIRLHNVLCLNNTLLLTPETCQLVGGGNDVLDEAQPAEFEASLGDRLDKAKEYFAQAKRKRTVVKRSAPAKTHTAPPRRTAKTEPTTQRTKSDPASQSRASQSSSAAAKAARLAAIQAALEPRPPTAPKVEVQYVSDDEIQFIDDDELDDSFFAQVEAVEAAAARRTRSQRSQRSARSIPEDAEIIEISD